MARYSFNLTDGPDEGQKFQLEPGITLVGRRDTAADDDPPGSRRWVLTDPAISRTHARIDWDGKGEPVLIHLSSTNATLLEGRIVTGSSIDDGQLLSHGNRLRMGQTGMEVVKEEDKARWFLLDRHKDDEETVLMPGESYQFDGLTLNCQGPMFEVTLTNPELEAYLLRNQEDQIWTTPLRPDKPLTLQDCDILRTEENKLVLQERAT